MNGYHATVDPWRIALTGSELARPAFEETLFTLSNGSLGVRGGLEERDSSTQNSFISNVWERSDIEYHERFPGFARTTDTRLPVPDGTAIRLHLGDQPVDPDQGEWLHFERQLDLRNGRLTRVLRWRAPQGGTLEVHAERVVPLDQPALLCIRYRVTSVDYDGPLRLVSSLLLDRTATSQGHDPRIGVRVHGGLELRDARADHDEATLCQQTQHSGVTLLSAQRHAVTGHDLGVTHAECDASGAHQHLEAHLQPGQSVTLEKYVAYAWSEAGTDTPESRLRAELEKRLQAAEAGFDHHAKAQVGALTPLWDAADLQVDGDPRSEQALRFNLFHVFQAVVRNGRGSIAAKGLTGEGYEGHYFWDAEIFALPVLVFVAPQLTRGMLEYRYGILDAARRHAREMNHASGALYAWRTISGDECSAYFPSGSAQYHINAAIAYAIDLYVQVTGDEDFLWQRGAEMLFETARIWLQAGHFNPRRDDAFCIHAVTGPDEYTALVDNDHYTNRMAREHLWEAARVARRMRDEHADAWAALVRRIGLDDDEPGQWQRAADAMYLPVDSTLGVFPQDDTFLDRPPWPTPQPAPGTRKAPLLLSHHPLTLYRHQVCKQADVLLALVLAGHDVDRDAYRRNLDYYERVTVHDSTLSASTFSIAAADVGDMARAWRYFTDSLRVDLDDTHGNADHGLHMAAMSGSWLDLAWGFGGLRVHDGTLHLAPKRPPLWRGYGFGLLWRGQPLRVRVEGDTVAYTLGAGPDLTLQHHGRPLTLHAGRTETLRLDNGPRHIVSRQLRAVIFDLDGVLADTAPMHQAAWAQLAAELDIPFDDSLGERLKGVDRATSLQIILDAAGIELDAEERAALADRKNRYYRERIAEFGPQHLLPGAREALESTRAAGLRVGLASASRNASALLDKLGIAALFDHVVDAARIPQSKPAPDIFLAAAAGLGVSPEACLGVEDAVAGIAAIRAAGMAALGIGDASVLRDADAVLPDLTAFDTSALTPS